MKIGDEIHIRRGLGWSTETHPITGLMKDSVMIGRPGMTRVFCTHDVILASDLKQQRLAEHKSEHDKLLSSKILALMESENEPWTIEELEASLDIEKFSIKAALTYLKTVGKVSRFQETYQLTPSKPETQ